jgi:hypothetical protein
MNASFNAPFMQQGGSLRQRLTINHGEEFCGWTGGDWSSRPERDHESFFLPQRFSAGQRLSRAT